MPMHDWTRVPDGIYHAFHHHWLSAISDWLNSGILPPEFYALIEGPVPTGSAEAWGVRQADAEFYRRKKSSIVVRHVSGDRIVAMAEIVSPGNKASAHAFRAFMDKVYELLEYRIHLLIIDPYPPTKRDPKGVHSAIWEAVQDEPFDPPADKPLTLVAYECDLTTRAYIEPVAVGDVLPDMPLYLEPEWFVSVPLEETYAVSWRAMPARWQRVLDPGQA